MASRLLGGGRMQTSDVVARAVKGWRRATGCLVLLALACGGGAAPQASELAREAEQSNGGMAGGSGEQARPRAGAECSDLSAPVVVACVRETGQVFDLEEQIKLSVPEAQVVEERIGVMKGSCLEPFLRRARTALAVADRAKTFRIAAGDRSWDVEIAVEGSDIPSLEGQTVSLSYSYHPEDFSPTLMHLGLATLSNPARGVWVAQGGELVELQDLPLQLSRGGVACSGSDDCLRYDGYEIHVMQAPGEPTLNVPYGQAATLGPWIVVHGGYLEQTSVIEACADAFVADVNVAIFGLE